MLQVALTGGIATGKSHVLERFAANHVPTVDADRIARDVVRSGEPAWSAIRARFGSDVFAGDGRLDRQRLATRVFADPAARANLETIVHPHVRRAIDAWFQQVAHDGDGPFAVADIPLLFETHRAEDFDRVVVTACDQDTQLRRLMERDEFSEDDAQRRLAAQLPTAHKVARADFVVQTGGPFEETDRQVDAICRALGR